MKKKPVEPGWYYVLIPFYNCFSLKGTTVEIKPIAYFAKIDSLGDVYCPAIGTPLIEGGRTTFLWGDKIPMPEIKRADKYRSR